MGKGYWSLDTGSTVSTISYKTMKQAGLKSLLDTSVTLAFNALANQDQPTIHGVLRVPVQLEGGVILRPYLTVMTPCHCPLLGMDALTESMVYLPTQGHPSLVFRDPHPIRIPRITPRMYYSCEIRWGQKVIQVSALVDTGCSLCVMSPSQAQELGVPVEGANQYCQSVTSLVTILDYTPPLTLKLPNGNVTVSFAILENGSETIICLDVLLAPGRGLWISS